MRDNYAVDCYAAVSNIHFKVEAIKYALREADEALEYFELIGKGAVVMYSDYSQLDYIERLRRFIIKEEQMLIGNMKTGDFESAQRTLNLIFEKYFFDDVKSPQLIRCRLFALINNIVDTLATLEIPDGSSFIENLHPFGRILYCSNANELQQQLNQILGEIGNFFTSENANEEYRLKKRIIKIVEENYANPDLNVSFIADMVGKNLDYVSRTFKKTTLIGLLDYIHHTRIDTAKKLLSRGSDLTIQQIASMVGYTNPDSFIRAFKRINGTTPGQYRNRS